MILTEFEQGTQEWLEARASRATASRFKDILATLKSGGESSSRRNYRAELVLERLTGEPLESFKSSAMAWGNETEDLARTTYMLTYDIEVQQVGFAQHDTLMAGASPDGLIGTDGGLEIKCRIPANHIESLKLGRMPLEHKAQVQGNMWIFDRKWWDYLSFDPRFPPNAQMLVDRIQRDDEYIKMLEAHVRQFLDEVDEDVEFVRNYRAKEREII